MNNIERELERLAADIRDDLARAQYMGKASVGTWMLEAYEQRIERLLKEQREGQR